MTKVSEVVKNEQRRAVVARYAKRRDREFAVGQPDRCTNRQTQVHANRQPVALTGKWPLAEFRAAPGQGLRCWRRAPGGFG